MSDETEGFAPEPEPNPLNLPAGDVVLVYEGPRGLTITYMPAETGSEVSIHCGEQERLCLSLRDWEDLVTAADTIGPFGIAWAADVRGRDGR